MLAEQERIQSKAQLRDWLQYELRRYPCGCLSYLLQAGENSILKKHQILLRKAEFYLNTNKKIRFSLVKFRLRKIQTKYALYIPFNCCGRGLHIVHLGSVLINNTATIGENCSFHMNTAVVAGGTNDFSPVIGNGVIVGYGAVVLGKVEIANNVAIGANAVVNKSVVENNVAVAGVPAKVISHNGTMEWNKKAKMASGECEE